VIGFVAAEVLRISIFSGATGALFDSQAAVVYFSLKVKYFMCCITNS